MFIRYHNLNFFKSVLILVINYMHELWLILIGFTGFHMHIIRKRCKENVGYCGSIFFNYLPF